MYTHPNNRAELRAVLAALTFSIWWGEGWQRVVLVTDSEYVANHATGWLRNWATRGCRTASGRPVANRDLWDELSRIMGVRGSWMRDLVLDCALTVERRGGSSGQGIGTRGRRKGQVWCDARSFGLGLLLEFDLCQCRYQ